MPPPRRLGLLDVMILVAASALGLAACRAFVSGLLGGGTSLTALLQPSGYRNAREVSLRVADLLALGLTVCGPWTFALAIVALRHGRAGRRRLAREPGATACLAAIAGLAAGAAMLGLILAVRTAFPADYATSTRVEIATYFLCDDLLAYPGTAVLAAWAVQAAAGRRRPRPDPIDRLGRAVGVLWIAAALAYGARRYLIYV